MKHRRVTPERQFAALAGMGLALGAAAVLLWPYVTTYVLSPLITVGRPLLTRKGA